MPEIYQFPIHKADAEVTDKGLKVRLFYPPNPMPEKRLPENLQFGVQVFEDLVKVGHAEIADAQNPIGPCGGGSIYILNDGVFVCHRRDAKAPGHALYHSGYSGWPDSREAVFTADGLEATWMRESAEEGLLVTRDAIPRLIVPNDSRNETLESAKRLGLELKPRFVDVERVEPYDTLEVYNHTQNLIFRTKANLHFIYESMTSLNGVALRRFPVASEEVFPIDAEGMTKPDGKFIHFNRESYVVSPDEVKTNQSGTFGRILKNPRVFRTRFENGIPHVYTPEYTEPFLGPDSVTVVHPHVWAPENVLCRALDALGVDGYKGRWVEIELWKERSKLEGKSLLSEEVLKK